MEADLIDACQDVKTYRDEEIRFIASLLNPKHVPRTFLNNQDMVIEQRSMSMHAIDVLDKAWKRTKVLETLDEAVNNVTHLLRMQSTSEEKVNVTRVAIGNLLNYAEVIKEIEVCMRQIGNS